MNRQEIDDCVKYAEEMLVAYTDDNILETRIFDAIANLLILAHERGINTADVVVKGAAHWCATYIEGMSPEPASVWLEGALFPWSGEDDFETYIARKAISLAGQTNLVKPPEFGI